ncbi:uncharacterized protein EV422DRAFT_23848 [Fimicolochytrium jonesii]|uniref:uncharacterized protein n=1 Tax=Fimicolochytrium jonesii TaxID=1396493 RepID=UPI0022FEA0A8|nr:uncharacterized protein EV422DRAFT_23848 [Fimicolochytrium jonesii]KAI8827064.1 hypothetical protein EV422DRAFT_23848 [Fimicolochytrium jonesii]
MASARSPLSFLAAAAGRAANSLEASCTTKRNGRSICQNQKRLLAQERYRLGREQPTIPSTRSYSTKAAPANVLAGQAATATERGRVKRMVDALQTGNYQRIVHDFLKLHKNGNASPEAYRIVLEACSQIGDLDTARRVVALSHEAGVELPIEMYMYLLKAAANGPNRMERLVQLLVELERDIPEVVWATFRGAPTEFVARVLLLEGGEEHAEGALALLDGASEASAIPPARRNLVLLALGTLGKVEEFEALLELNRTSASSEYHASVILGLWRLGRHDTQLQISDAAEAMLKTLRRELKEDTNTWNANQELIMKAIEVAFLSCAEQRSLSKALQIKQAGRALTQHSPRLSAQDKNALLKALDVGTLNLIRTLVKASYTEGQSVGARRDLHTTWTTIVEDMRYRRTIQDIDTSLLVLELQVMAVRDGLSTTDKVSALFEDMKKDGLYPTVDVYNTLAYGCATAPGVPRSERVARVLQIIETIRGSGNQPNATSYACLFTAFEPDTANPSAETSDPNDDIATHVQNIYKHETEMLQSGLRHDAVSASAMIIALLRLQQHEQAAQRFTDMRLTHLPRSLALYNQMLHACAADPSGGAAVYAIRDLIFTLRREQGITPDRETYQGLLECCERTDDVVAALYFFDQMRMEEIVGNAEMYRILMRLMEPRGKWVENEKKVVVECMKMDGVRLGSLGLSL